MRHGRHAALQQLEQEGVQVSKFVQIYIYIFLGTLSYQNYEKNSHNYEIRIPKCASVPAQCCQSNIHTILSFKNCNLFLKPRR